MKQTDSQYQNCAWTDPPTQTFKKKNSDCLTAASSAQ